MKACLFMSIVVEGWVYAWSQEACGVRLASNALLMRDTRLLMTEPKLQIVLLPVEL